MKTYHILYAEECVCHGMIVIDAANDGEAIARAIAHNWHEVVTEPEFDSASNRRIITIDQGDRNVAFGIPLDLDETTAPDIAKAATALLSATLQRALAELQFQQKHFPRADDTELREVIGAINSVLAQGGSI